MIGIAAVAVVALAACGGGGGGAAAPVDEAAAGPPVAGGTVTVGHMFPVLADAPWNITGSTTDGVVMRAIYDTLVSIGQDNQVVPGLAESWTISDDKKTFTFQLRQGVKFSDGTDFNADAVVWNLNMHLNPANKSRSTSLANQIATVQATSPNTVVITTKNPYPAFLNATAVSPLMAQASPTAIAANPRAAVGTGPFKVVSYQAGQEIVLEKNPNYWQSGKPYLDRVTVRSILDNSTRMISLRQGEVDAVSFVEGQYFKDLAKNGFVSKARPGTPFILPMTNQRAPFTDPRVREAVVRALNLDAIAKAVFDGEAQPNPALIPADSQWLDKSVKYPTYDPARAKQLVDEYEAENGPIRFTFTSDNINYMKTVAEIASQMWAQVGIEVKTEILETNVFIQKMQAGEVDIASFGAGSAVDPDLAYYNVLHSGTASNTSRYSNPEMDAALEAGRTATSDDARKQAYNKVQELLARDLPIFGYLQTNWGFATSPKLHGWVTGIDYALNWADVWRSN